MKDDLLSLEADICGPLDEAGKVTLGLDISADAKVSRSGLEQRVFGSLGRLGGGERGRGGLLRGLSFRRLELSKSDQHSSEARRSWRRISQRQISDGKPQIERDLVHLDSAGLGALVLTRYSSST